MERKFVLRSFLLIAVCLSTRSLASGADDRTSLHANKTLPHSSSANKKLTVYRSENVEMGTTVTLNCTKTKIPWDGMIFVIWKIYSRDKECFIAMAKNDSDHDTCQDGKKMIYTADGTYHLIIPNFSLRDEGNYICDTSYQSGGSMDMIKVTAWARPELSGWLESEPGHTVAVCKAKGKPASSIHWEEPWNLFNATTEANESTGQLSTVISRLHLPRNTSFRNLTCVAIASDTTKIRFSFSSLKEPQARWPLILVGVCATSSTVALLAGFYIMRKNLKQSSIFRKICCKPDIPVSSEGKPQQPQDPEELQPYASYVQRVNSIYNSSAELFNA